MSSAPGSARRDRARRMASLVAPYLALVLLHLLSGLPMEQPLILADELGYLGNARYLSTVADLPDMRDSAFYHFGYSLFLVPAFWLFAEPVSTYKTAMVINALLVSALYFPLLFILESVLRVAATTARWIAFACCLYPPLVLYSSYAWSENAFIPFYALAVALCARLLVSRSSRDAVLFSLVGGFLYTIHPRALPVLVAILVYLGALALLRAITARQLLLGASTLASVVALTRIVNQHLEGLGWRPGAELSATKLAGRLLPGAETAALVERAMGQLLYLTLATHGLFLVGVAAMIWLIRRSAASRSLRRVLVDPASGVSVFILVGASGVLLASSTLKLYSLHGPAGLRGADFIHGRYNEAFAVFGIAFGLVECLRAGAGGRRLLWRSLGVAAMVLLLTIVVMAEVDDALERQVAGTPELQPQERVPASWVDAIAVPGIYPMVELAGGLNLYSISLAVVVSFTLISLTLRVSQRAGVALLVLLFSGFAFFNHHHYLLPRVERARPRLAFASAIQQLGPIPTLSFDIARDERGLLEGLQYLLQETPFHLFDSRKGGEPRSEVVVSWDHWPQARRLGARFVVASGRGSALWLLPGEMQSRLPNPAWVGVTLGAVQNLELQESGFYRGESVAGEPGRWTNGAASLRVPLAPGDRPRALEIVTSAPGRDEVRLQLLVNGVELWHRRIPGRRWSRRFDLEEVPLNGELLIELNSDTFTPAESLPSSGDRRTLGVVVLGIRLTAGVGSAAPDRPLGGAG